MKKIKTYGILSLILVANLMVKAAEPSQSERIATLEQQLKMITQELQNMKVRQETAEKEHISVQTRLNKVDESITDWNDFKEPMEKMSFGGYGEMHANFNQGEGGDYFDIHRLVLYLGYDFADWIKLNSEIEIEHAYASSDESNGGEVGIEQLYVDFLLHESFNLRAGRVLAPLGITNQRHEPT
ncbi:MAG: hypothetical protein PF904_04445 [Kiritimatiellae bacterium]|jgi:hypothetical protein|nr:hypothetical protein [Kiritimatiellia bacterium]